MIDLERIAQQLKEKGIKFAVGNPSSLNSNLFNLFDLRFELLRANSTQESVAIASGIALAKSLSIVIVDEMTLRSSLSVLEELSSGYNLPFIGFMVTSKNQPLSPTLEDELLLHHVKMLKLDPQVSLDKQIEEGLEYIEKTEKPLIFSIEKTQLIEIPPMKQVYERSKLPLIIKKSASQNKTPLKTFLYQVFQTLPDQTAFLTTDPTTSKLIRENAPSLKALTFSSPDVIAQAVGLGYSIASKTPTVVLDTPSTLLSQLFTLSTIGYHLPKNYLYILFDNGLEYVTTSHKPLFSFIDFTALAHSLNIDLIYSIDSVSSFQEVLENWEKQPETTFIHVKIKPEKSISFNYLIDSNRLNTKENFMNRHAQQE